MQITDRGVQVEEYASASPGIAYSTFTDIKGAKLCIPTHVLVQMYELCKFDLQRRGVWGAVLKKAETH
jgi:hypothetical protein